LLAFAGIPCGLSQQGGDPVLRGSGGNGEVFRFIHLIPSPLQGGKTLNTTFVRKGLPVLSRLKLFAALSRTPHALLDMATPGLSALLWLGGVPPVETVVLGLITVFAGYTSVYALNDVVDYRQDKEKLQLGRCSDFENDLDVSSIRHPIAQNMLRLREGLIWVVAWAILALGGAYILNPICAVIFLCACLLEAIYCLLLKVTYLRTFLSGAVKTSGAIAAVVAVDSSPSLPFLFLLFLWVFFWEVGGQNVPNDWADREEDRRLGAKTLPVQLGIEKASVWTMGSLCIAVLMNLSLFLVTRYEIELPYILASLAIGFFFLLVPAYRLHKTRDRFHATALFNRASYYPLALLIVMTLRSIV
jgi:4-hydroxybenzoate polyprenyltransferase